PGTPPAVVWGSGAARDILPVKVWHAACPPHGQRLSANIQEILSIMAAPLEMTSESAAPEAILEGVSGEAIEGRSLGQIAWMRLKRDKVAIGSGIFIIFLLLVAIFGPYLVQDPTAYHANLINPTFSRPIGPWGGISLAHPLGVEPVTGRDVLARIVNGARVSMLIAF